MEARIFDGYDILFVGYTVFRGTFGRLYAFGGVSHRGSTLLGLATTCSLPTMFEGIVVPFMYVYGRHSIVHDGCPRFRHYRIRELVERNGISQYSLPSTTGPPQPRVQVWPMAKEHLRRTQPSTQEEAREELATFWEELSQSYIIVGGLYLWK